MIMASFPQKVLLQTLSSNRAKKNFSTKTHIRRVTDFIQRQNFRRKRLADLVGPSPSYGWNSWSPIFWAPLHERAILKGAHWSVWCLSRVWTVCERKGLTEQSKQATLQTWWGVYVSCSSTFWFIILLLLTLLSFYLSDTWSQIELIPGEFNSNGCGAVGLSWLILDPNPNSGLASRLVHAREHFARIISSSSTHWSIQLNFSWIFAWCYSCKSVVKCPTRFFRFEQRNIA